MTGFGPTRWVYRCNRCHKSVEACPISGAAIWPFAKKDRRMWCPHCMRMSEFHLKREDVDEGPRKFEVS